jgi:uncharacterized membrane protein YbhN (UPF0104 family)
MTSRSLAYAGFAVAAASAAALALFPDQLGRPIVSALHALAGAERWWLLAASAGFVLAFVCTVGAWRAAFAAAGGRIGTRQAAARLGIGALVNAVAPAKLGEAVKLALCGRVVETESKLRTLGGAYAALTAARSLALVALVVAASAARALPLWPAFGLLGVVAVVALLVATSSRVRAHGRVANVVGGLAELGRSPRRLAAVVGWMLGTVAAQLAATVAIAAALGLPHPFLAALVILPALELASAFPVTPGGIGVGSGAVAVALASRGIGMSEALGVGFAMQGVQTLVSVSAGSLGALYLLQPGPGAQRWLLRGATVGASAALAAVVSMLVVAAV